MRHWSQRLKNFCIYFRLAKNNSRLTLDAKNKQKVVSDTYSVNQKISLRRLRHRQQKIVADI